MTKLIKIKSSHWWKFYLECVIYFSLLNLWPLNIIWLSLMHQCCCATYYGTRLEHCAIYIDLYGVYGPQTWISPRYWDIDFFYVFVLSDCLLSVPSFCGWLMPLSQSDSAMHPGPTGCWRGNFLPCWPHSWPCHFILVPRFSLCWVTVYTWLYWLWALNCRTITYPFWQLLRTTMIVIK